MERCALKAAMHILLWVIALSFSIIGTMQSQWTRLFRTKGNGVTAFVQDGAKLYTAIPNRGIFLTTNSGTEWKLMNSGLSYTVSSFALSGEDLFACTTHGLYRSSDSGKNWFVVNTGFSDSPWSITASGYNIFAGTSNNGWLRSTDGGENWDLVNNTHTGTVCGHYFIAANEDGIWRLMDKDTAWTRVTSTRFLQSIYYFLVDGARIYAISGNGMFHSPDSGAHWIEWKHHRWSAHITSIVSYGKNLFAGTDEGLYLSKDDGVSWTIVTYNSWFVQSLTICGTTLLAGVNCTKEYRGWPVFRAEVWQRPLSELIDDVEAGITDLPFGITHYSFGPDAFGPASTITFGIPSKSFVSLQIFDAHWNEVAAIVCEELPAGRYERKWKAPEQSCEPYFCRLQAEGFSEIKMLTPHEEIIP